MKEKIDVDIVIVGSGAAGLFAALHMPEDKRVLVITKDKAENSDSFLAQGGICMLKSEEDYAPYFEDTMKAGHYKNNRKNVEIMIRSSAQVIDELEQYGVEFKYENGKRVFTREGGHSDRRILFHLDITGKEITGKLLLAAQKKKNITIKEFCTMSDLIIEGGECRGVVYYDADASKTVAAVSDFTILACGGIGGLYKNSTNFSHLTGDSIAICSRHNIAFDHLEYIQIHPTTLYSKKKGRRFLISESVRGEGARLLDKDFKPFTDELKPRDIVTAAIKKQMKNDGTDFVWLDMTGIGEKTIKEHFPNIYEQCLEEGYDCTKTPIPVVPGQHYFMGGIAVNSNSKTSCDRLYAAGEASCNGVHGANRLASNSLLESLVFAQRAASEIAGLYDSGVGKAKNEVNPKFEDMSQKDFDRLQAENIKFAKKEIERAIQMKDDVTMTVNAVDLIKQALKEDITSEDITTNAVMKEKRQGTAQLICKQDGIVAGLYVFKKTFELLDPEVSVQLKVDDGAEVKSGDILAIVTGDIRAILSGERTALNYLQRMSGIATYTNSVVKLLKGSKTKLLDTRKTTPNMRVFEKYAVKVGGGCNHRYNLSDGILIKDNHIGAAGSVKQAVKMAKEYAPFVRKIEVEVENLDMLREALEAGADIIMLDNMSVEDMKTAVEMAKGKAETECSGNVTKENVASLADIGVDYISSGALTHSAPILDVSLKNLKEI